MPYDDLAARLGIMGRSNPQFTQAELDPEMGEMEELGLAPSEEELFDAQDANTVQSPGGDYQYTPSRESMKTSGMQALRRQLRMSDIDAQNRALPSRIISEGKVREAQIHGQAAMNVASQNAGVLDRRAKENDVRVLNRQVANDKRDHEYGAAQQARAAAYTRASNIRSGREPIPAGGAMSGIKSLLRMGPSDADRREAAAQEVMNSVGQQQAPPPPGGDGSGMAEVDAQTAARMLMQKRPGMTLDQLMQEGEVTADSDEELQEMYAVWQSIGGR